MRSLVAAAFVLSITGVTLAETGSAAPSLSGCSTAATRRADETQFSERDPRYHLEPGDSFDITFEFVPDFNQTVIVQPDGFVTLRGIGDTKVANQTVPELTNTLCEAYSKILRLGCNGDPHGAVGEQPGSIVMDCGSGKNDVESRGPH